MIKNIIIILFIFLFSSVKILAEDYYIRDIYINNENIFDNKTLVNRFSNAIHFTTRKYIIEDELLFGTDEVLDILSVEETERNLRSRDLFRIVEIIVDTVAIRLVDIHINTWDRWSLTPAILFGTGGKESEFGGKLSEKNLFGTAYDIDYQAIHRTENNIGWQNSLQIKKNKIFSSGFDLNANLISNKFKSDGKIKIINPYNDFFDDYSYGVTYKQVNGDDFVYNEEKNYLLRSADLVKSSAYWSTSWVKEDRVFASVYLDYTETEENDLGLNRAFENSVKFLMQFSSVTEKYYKTKKLNYFKDEDLQVGGYGKAIIGRIIDKSDDKNSLWYVGGRGEKSFYNGDLYLYGMVEGGSGFGDSQAQYTYQGTNLLGFYRFTPELLISARIKQETAWNWPAYRQLVLDTRAGLRGVDANRLAGDSRFIGNLEFRAFPDWHFWLLDFSAVTFFDIGTVWTSESKFEKAHWYKSIGLGIRIHNEVLTGPNSVFRIDFPWNINENKFGGIVFTMDQAFSVHELHKYIIPDIFGLEFDEE
jgi:hypothetical protein